MNNAHIPTIRAIEDVAEAVDFWHEAHCDCYSLFGENARKQGKVVVKAFAEACLILYALGGELDCNRSVLAARLRADVEDPAFLLFLRHSRDDVLYRMTPLMLGRSKGWDIDMTDCRTRVLAGGDLHFPRAIFQCAGLWRAFRALGWSGCPYERENLLACSPFASRTPAGLIGISSAYGFAHWIMYLTDFGREVEDFRAWRHFDGIGATTNSLCARALCSQHLDLTIELAVASLCLDQMDPALLAGVFAALRRSFFEARTVAGDMESGSELDGLLSGPYSEWRSGYHCHLLTKLLLDMVRRTPAAADKNWWQGAEARFTRWQEIGTALKFVYEGEVTRGNQMLRRGGFEDLVPTADLQRWLDQTSA